MKIDRTNDFDLLGFLDKYNLPKNLVIKRQDSRALEILEFDPVTIKLQSFHSGPHNLVATNKVWQEGIVRSLRIPLDIAILDALLTNPDEMPECIKTTKGRGYTIPMVFDGTVLAYDDDRGFKKPEKYSDVDECLLFLYNNNDGDIALGFIRSYVGRGIPGRDFSVVI